MKELKFFIFSFVMVFIGACGVKKAPKPPKKPDYEVYRIGKYVYIVPKEEGLKVEKARKVGKNMVIYTKKPLCFRIQKEGKRTVKECVGGAVEGKPEYGILVRDRELVVKFKEEGTYRVYRYSDMPLPPPIGEVKGKEIRLERKAEGETYGITKVVGSAETEPVVIRVPPRLFLPPPPPQDVSYAVRGGKIYIFWRSPRDDLRFIVHRNGKPLKEKPIKAPVIVDDLPSEETVYEIFSVDERGLRSKPARLKVKLR